MTKIKIKMLLILIPLLILYSHQVFASSSENYCITVDVINSGGTEIVDGNEAESENYYLFGSIGQSIIHLPQILSESYDLNAGFLYGYKATSVTPDNDNICFGDDNCPSHYNPDQLDTYPPQGNGIGDACDCEANFDCDLDVDANDITAFLIDFGRSQYYRPCSNEDQCKGDFECDGDVDSTDVTKFLQDFGRSQYNNPCPACVAGDWCVYP